MDRVLTPAAFASTDVAPVRVIATGNVRWELLGGASELLSSHDVGLPVERWVREGFGTAVKQGAGRIVYRVDLPHRSLYVKHVRERGAVQGIKRWFRAGACRREFEKSLELARRGVSAVAPVALGERRVGFWSNESFLVTAAVPQACSLDELASRLADESPSPQRAVVRRRLIDAVARLCAAAHDAGVDHDDLHGGNILLRLDTCRFDSAEPPQLYFVDLPGVALSGPLDVARTRASLAMLGAGFWDRTTESERLRFWRSYRAARCRLTLDDDDAFAMTVRAAALEHARRTVDRRDKRAWGDNRDFFSLRNDAGTAHAVRDLPRSLVESWLRAPDDLWRAHADQPVKLSVGSLVVAAELPSVSGAAPLRVAIKRLRPKSIWKRMAGMFRRHRAWDAWFRGHALLARGVPTTRPLAAYEPMHAARGDGYLITEWLADAQDLHLYAWDLAGRNSDERRHRLRQTAVAIGKIVGRLHDQRFTHRDLKANNLLVRELPDGVEGFLIDLDGLRHGSRPDRELCCKNLARLALSVEMHPWISRTDRLRFLRAYLRRYDATAGCEWKRWWRTTATHVVAELAELRRAGRAVT